MSFNAHRIVTVVGVGAVAIPAILAGGLSPVGTAIGIAVARFDNQHALQPVRDDDARALS